MDFPVKSDQLTIIVTRGSDEALLTKALTIIHNDILCYSKHAVTIYCSRGLLEGLINLCSSSRSHLVIILATSLLYSICICGEGFQENFFKLHGFSSLLAMISSRDNIEQGQVVMNRTLLIHEQASKLLALLSGSNIRYQQELIKQGFQTKIVELCNIFSNGVHNNCCFSQLNFEENARTLTKTLIEGKKLIGKIDPDQSSASRSRGSLNVLAIDLFDTTTPEDIHINKELLRLGIAWPDSIASVSSITSTAVKIEEQGECWSDIFITKVIDAHCFWAHIDSRAAAKIIQISDLLDEYMYSSGVCPTDQVSFGEKVFCSINATTSKWMRGCVLEVSETNECLVLLVDYGFVVKIDNEQLYPLPEVVKEIPHQANLCILKGIKAAPTKAVVLEYACEILCNMAKSGHATRMQLHTVGSSEALLKLVALPNKRIVIRAAAAISNFALNFNIREQIGLQGGCKIILDQVCEFLEDNEVLEVLLGCLINLIVECIRNRNIMAENKCLLVLMKVFITTNKSITNKELILKAMKNLVGDGWRLIDPVNIPDVRGIIEEQIDSMKGCFNLPNICGEDVLEEVRKRRQRKQMRRGEAPPTPIHLSLSSDDLIRTLKLDNSSDNDTKSEGYRTGPDTDGEEIATGIEKKLSCGEFEGYLYKKNIGAENECTAFMHEHNIRLVRAIDIGNTVCAMLNNSIGGVIYIGVTPQGLTVGINIARKERDNLRLSVDDLLERFTPRVKHDKYEIKFVPVMIGNTIESLAQHEERYVIEVRIASTSNQLYQTPSKKVFFRDGNKNSELTMQQVREKAICEQEKKYQAEIEALRLTLRETRNQLNARNAESSSQTK